MKKMLLIICFIFSITLGIIIVLSFNKNIVDTLKVVSIPKSYCYKYKDNRRMSFDIYLNEDNSLILEEEYNTYKLITTNSYFNLNNVNVNVEYNCNYKNEDFYKYTINADILNIGNLDIKDCYLEIMNNSYTLLINIGSLKIINNDLKELSFSELYGNYSYINEELYLTGITITIDPSYYKLYSLKIGEGFGNLEYIEKDIYKDNEIEIFELNHNVLDSFKFYDGIELNAEYHTYFIPISYLKNYLITNSMVILNIDHENYYIDNFSYVLTNVFISNYQNLNIGEILYA